MECYTRFIRSEGVLGCARECVIVLTKATGQLHVHIILQRYNETSVKRSVVFNLEGRGGGGGAENVQNYCKRRGWQACSLQLLLVLNTLLQR